MVALNARKFATTAPRAAFIAVTSILKGGSGRAIKYADAIVAEKEANANEAAGKARVTHATAGKLEAEAQSAEAAAQEAPKREKIITDKQSFEFQKQKADAFLDLFERIQKIEDPDVRAKCLVGYEANAKELLGPIADHWLQPPPSNE